MSFSILFFWFSQVLSSCEAKTVRLKKTTIQSKFKDKTRTTATHPVYRLLSSSSFYTIFFLLSFPPKPLICSVISTPSQPSLSTDLSLLIQINKKFGTQEHLGRARKKNGAQSLKRCLCSLLVGGCARDRRLQV